MIKNQQAFLDMIAWAEIGPSVLAASDNGYNVLVGSIPGRVRLFYNYADHPRILVQVKSRTPDGQPTVIHSTAAGRYQILRRIYDHYRRTLGLPGFYPECQDQIALQLIRERGALDDITAGRIPSAITKCRSAWASLPGAGYGQPEKRLSNLLHAYTLAGGSVI